MDAAGLRSGGAGRLRAGEAGRTVRLAGWVNSRRDHGGIVFIDLRDASGVAQIVIDPEVAPDAADTAHRLRAEWCIAIEGVVRMRPDGTVNSALASGDVEVVAGSLVVLGPADPLPFQIDDRAEVDELRRLEFRYLDLRRSRMAEKPAGPIRRYSGDAAGARPTRFPGGGDTHPGAFDARGRP